MKRTTEFSGISQTRTISTPRVLRLTVKEYEALGYTPDVRTFRNKKGRLVTRVKAGRAVTWVTAAFLLALATTGTASAHDMPPLPAQCADTGRVTEFGGPVLQCVDGKMYYQDMDGAGGYNSGIPYRPPGTWVQVTK